MQNAQTIYQQTILPLPKSEKILLATIILQNLSDETEEKTSALEFLENLQVEGVFKTSDKVDEYLKEDRESWDN